MLHTTTSHIENNAWYRQIAAGWARQILTGNMPDAWAQDTDTEVQFAVTQLDLRPDDPVLDLGCGWGRHSIPLARYGLRVTGLDLSHDLLMLARYYARRHGLHINWVEADVADMPLRGPFEAVVQFCDNLMTWFANRERTLDVLWNVANLLRPGGRLLCGTQDWQADLPARSQSWDEWEGGAAIYRQRFDQHSRINQTQTVVFGPEHKRHEYRRQTWWPTLCEMETMFRQVGLNVWERYSTFDGQPFDPDGRGLVYVLVRD
ncbi:MAG: class I SAM-dependent methyltransferase [Chloroflexi bacterium]|nr:class I SAM-dependent methyltransferase [Chloroflexota bacterium]